MKTQPATTTRATGAAVRVGAALGRMAAKVDKLTGRGARTKSAAPPVRTRKPRTQVAAERRVAKARSEPVKRRMLSEEARARDAIAQTQQRRRSRARMG